MTSKRPPRSSRVKTLLWHGLGEDGRVSIRDSLRWALSCCQRESKVVVRPARSKAKT
jgi:hypothetical protein